jgi:hypothetical protein
MGAVRFHSGFRRQVGWLIALLFAFAPYSVWAQGSREEFNTRLQTTVHLSLGETTLGEVVDSLSKQTGLTIYSDTYLRDHRLIVQLDGVSAAAALDTLAELNDWTWRRVDDAHVVLTRPTIPAPQKNADIATALQQALPKDFRRFLDVVKPSEPNARTEQSNRIPEIQEGANQSFRMQQMRDLFNNQQRDLYQSFMPNIFEGRKVLYSQLTSAQKQDILIAYLMYHLKEMYFVRPYVFNGKLYPFESDPDKMEIRLDGKMVQFGIKTTDGELDRYNFFGAPYENHFAPLQPRTKTAPPTKPSP